MRYRLGDLIDIEQFQGLLERLNDVYSFTTAILDNDGNILTAAGWQEVCTKFHRQHEDCARSCAESDLYILDHLAEANPAFTYRCANGLTDSATPIIIDGEHLGNFFTGQFFLEPPDLEFFRAQAELYGFAVDEYLAAVQAVPVWSPEQLNGYVFFIKGLIEVISAIGLKNLRALEAHRQIAESEEQFRVMFETAAIGMGQSDPQSGQYLRVNQRLCEITGYSREELLAMRMRDLTHPFDREADWQAFQRVVRGEAPSYRLEQRCLRKGGQEVWVNVNMSVIRDVAGQPWRAMAAVEDITERKGREEEIHRLNRLYAALSQINQFITRAKTEDELLVGVCDILVGYGGLEMAWVGWLDRDTAEVRCVAQAGDTGGYLTEITVHADERPTGRGPTGTAIRERHAVVCNDLVGADETSPWHAAAGRHGFGSSAGFPVADEGRGRRGALSVYAREAGYFRDKEVQLFEEAASDITFALGHLQQEAARRLAEESLRESEQRLRLALEGAELGTWDWHLPSGAVVFDERWASMLGHALGEIEPVYSSWAGRLHPDDRAAADHLLAEHLAGRSDTYESEHRLRHRSGGWVWVLARGRVTERDAYGRPVRACGTHLDITARKRAEEELRRSSELLAYTEHLAKVGGWTYDVARQQMTWTDETYRIHGLEPVSQPVVSPEHLAFSLGCYAPEDRLELERSFRRCVADGTPYHLECGLNVAGGRRLWVRTMGRPVTDGGQVVRVAGHIVDVTEQKRAEEARRETEAQYRAILRTALDGFCVVAADGRLLEVNETLCRLVGYSEAELLSMSLTDLEAVESPADTAAHMHRVVTQGEDRFESRHRRKDGSLLDIEVSVQYRSDGGRFVAFMRDITARKQVEAERERLQAQLAQAQRLESVGRLAGGVAHDFNNLLTVITGHTQLALDMVDPASGLHADLTTVRAAAQRSGDLTRQLLAFARQQAIAPRVLDLNVTVASLLKMMQRLIGEGISLHWNPAADLWPIMVDPSQIDQIMANLCVNARDAIGDVGHLTITTSNRTMTGADCSPDAGPTPGDYVRIAVTDTGCGMDEETQAHIFEPFFSTKGPGQGTGLGLATVYGAVTQNNGFVQVDSVRGRGATFTVYLPRHTEPAGTTTPATAEPALRRGHETLLLVEDDPSVLMLATRVLEALGYTVLTAPAPGEAIRLAREHQGRFDLLMTDVIMPEMNGRDLAEAIQAEFPELKVLFMSGYTADVIGHHGVLDAGVHFIAKPFDRNELAAKVRNTLDSR